MFYSEIYDNQINHKSLLKNKSKETKSSYIFINKRTFFNLLKFFSSELI
jgi:hypothetical protein